MERYSIVSAPDAESEMVELKLQSLKSSWIIYDQCNRLGSRGQITDIVATSIWPKSLFTVAIEPLQLGHVGSLLKGKEQIKAVDPPHAFSRDAFFAFPHCP